MKEPCMCGADDCRYCFPNRRVEMNCTICKGKLVWRDWDCKYECENCGEEFEEDELFGPLYDEELDFE